MNWAIWAKRFAHNRKPLTEYGLNLVVGRNFFAQLKKGNVEG